MSVYDPASFSKIGDMCSGFATYILVFVLLVNEFLVSSSCVVDELACSWQAAYIGGRESLSLYHDDIMPCSFLQLITTLQKEGLIVE